MSLSLFVDYFAEWANEYNTARAHSELGETPLARWLSDATPIRKVPAEQLRWMLMADEERTVCKDGVHFGGIAFVAGALNGLVGERVQVRYLPHDLRHIKVFPGGDSTWEVLSREPMLRSRVFRRVTFTSLSPAKVCELIGAFHPVYDGVSRELLLLVDGHFAHGNLRDWASFTYTAAKLCADQGRRRLDEEVARNAFALHGCLAG